MSLEDIQRNWEKLAQEDPLWAILTEPSKKGRKWNLEDFFETGQSQVEAVFNRMAQLGMTVMKGKALDFGCGVGRLSKALASRFVEVYGVDISAKMVELACELVGDSKCHFIVNTRDDLSLFRDGEFDFVLSLLTLQHMKPANSMMYVAEFLRVLNPQGALFFNLPESPVHGTHRVAALQFLEERVDQFRRYPTLGNVVQLRALRSRFSRAAPKMEHHFVPRKQVSKVVAKNGGRILARETLRDRVSYLTTGYYIEKL